MIIVADSSPLIVLLNIDHVAILPALFGQVVIPPQVEAELLQPNRPKIVREFMSQKPSGLKVIQPKKCDPIQYLYAGENAAICLAAELDAELLLIDESRGRQVAVDRQIRIAGTIGVLEMAAKANLVQLREAFERVKRTDFWVSSDLLDRRLQAFEKHRG